MDSNDSMNTFESWKNDFVETDADGNFVKIRRLVNEANLVFYVDNDVLSQLDAEKEPHRLYVYNIDDKRPLEDYFVDAANNSLPSVSRINHLGALQRVDDEPTGDGIKYKFRITEHINNLLLRDSTNVATANMWRPTPLPITTGTCKTTCLPVQEMWTCANPQQL